MLLVPLGDSGLICSDGDEEGDDDLLQVREKTPAELEEEQKALQSAIVEIQSLSSNLPSAEQEKDAFLTQYMLKQKWKDEMEDLDTVGAVPVPDEEDEEDLDKMDQFESTYNFRFEEEGGVEIQSYARNVQVLLNTLHVFSSKPEKIVGDLTEAHIDRALCEK